MDFVKIQSQGSNLSYITKFAFSMTAKAKLFWSKAPRRGLEYHLPCGGIKPKRKGLSLRPLAPRRRLELRT